MSLGTGETVPLATFADRRRGRLTEAIYVAVILIPPAFAVGSLLALLQFHPAADKGALDKALWLYVIGVLAALLAVAAYEAWSTATGRPRWRDVRAGTRVVRLRDGRSPGLVASLGRSILPIIAGFVGIVVGLLIPWDTPLDLMVGPAVWALLYATAFWDDHGRGWHDKLAGTVVIKDSTRRMDWWAKQAPEDPGASAD
ncbi:MAG: RDD family protein [Acidimicrobiaceae bacterium]|nr:RDD family protein [Acidimicrobiaceae bacterium]